MKKWNKSSRMLALVGFSCMAAGLARAEIDAGVTSLITSVQTTATGIIAAVVTAGAAILLAMLTLKALPFAYRKIAAFFAK